MMSFTILFWLVLTLTWPLMLVGMTTCTATRAWGCRLSPWAAVPAVILAVFIGPSETFYFSWLLLGTELGLDDTGHIFLLLTALLWWLAAVYAKGYLPLIEQARFFSFFNVAMLGNVGLILAQDMLSFYLFFTLMSFASYGLVVHERHAAASYAGKIYIILVIVGEVALFAALAWAAVIAETLSFEFARPVIAQSSLLDWVISLALIGFGIKAGVIILHVWLPLAHPVAPTPASAVLSGSMIKAGLLGWLKLLPLGEALMHSWGGLFITLGLIAAFYAVAVGLMQHDAKTLLAYSSISQMGVLTAAVGLGLMVPAAWPGILATILVYTLHHGLAKGSLFLGVGVLGKCSGHWRRLAWVGLWLPALALAGAPFTSGMVAKTLLKMQTLHAPDIWSAVFQTLLPCSAIATALLLGKFLFMLSQPVSTRKTEPLSVPTLMVPWVVLLMLVASLPWWPLASETDLWSGDILLDSLWPVMLAGLIMLVSVTRNQWLPRRFAINSPTFGGQIFSPRIPPGDILAPIEWIIHYILNGARRLCCDELPHRYQSLQSFLQRIRTTIEWQHLIERLEWQLCRWPTALMGFLVLGLILGWGKMSF